MGISHFLVNQQWSNFFCDVPVETPVLSRPNIIFDGLVVDHPPEKDDIMRSSLVIDLVIISQIRMKTNIDLR